MLDRALQGISVVEIATYIPGPACGRMLAGMGASVTKIERPGGDPMRTMPPLDTAGVNPMYAPFNADKTIIELDLKAQADAEHLRGLLADADVLIDGLRPGALARMGFGVTALHAMNPGLIVCAISAFGVDGPDAAKPGHDMNFLAQSGFLSLGMLDGTPALPGAQVADLLSAMTATAAILAGLQARSRHGRGMLLDAAMISASQWLMMPWYATVAAGVALPPGALHELNGAQACYHLYRTADGRHLAVAALEPHFWARFCTALERPDLIELHTDPVAQPGLIAAIQAIIATRDLAHWSAVFAEVEACVGPVQSIAEALPERIDMRLPLRNAD